MYKVYRLTRNTFLEMLHERLFLVVIVLAIFLIALSFLLGALSFDEQKKILADFGFLAIQISGLGISLFSGAYMIHREIEKQTCLLMLARPVTRNQFFLGKFFGVLALNTLLLVALGLVLRVLLGFSFPWTSFGQILLSLWFESAVILAFVLAASMMVRPVLALALGFCLFLWGHWLGDLAYFAKKMGSEFSIQLVQFLGWISPNFHQMNWKSYFFLQNGVPTDSVMWMIPHCVGWIIVYLLMGQFLFRRKDIV